MKNKIILILSSLFLMGCGVVQPEANKPVEEEQQYPNDYVIVGITDKYLEEPYTYEENMLEFYNSEDFNKAYENFFAFVSYFDGGYVSIRHGFDSINIQNKGDIIAENQSGLSFLTVDVTYPIFGNDLSNKYHFYSLVANLQEKTIFSKSFFQIGDLENGLVSYVSMNYETSYAAYENNEITKYYKYSEAKVNLNGDNFELTSYVMHEYDSNNELIKSVPGVLDFEEYINEYVTDENCHHVIMEKTGNQYKYSFESSSLIKTPVVLREAFNVDDSVTKTTFFTKNGENIEKYTVSVIFGSQIEE